MLYVVVLLKAKKYSFELVRCYCKPPYSSTKRLLAVFGLVVKNIFDRGKVDSLVISKNVLRVYKKNINVCKRLLEFEKKLLKFVNKY